MTCAGSPLCRLPHGHHGRDKCVSPVAERHFHDVRADLLLRLSQMLSARRRLPTRPMSIQLAKLSQVSLSGGPNRFQLVRNGDWHQSAGSPRLAELRYVSRGSPSRELLRRWYFSRCNPLEKTMTARVPTLAPVTSLGYQGRLWVWTHTILTLGAPIAERSGA